MSELVNGPAGRGSGGEHVVRAHFDDRTVRVYQAFPREIAMPALSAGRFVPPFSLDRMTWIKPSFTWMMYRSGWAMKARQEHVLAISVSREGFDWALAHAALSHDDRRVYDTAEAWRTAKGTSPVVVQWDPERTLAMERLDVRAVQIGLSSAAARHYVAEWTQEIRDVTPLANTIRELVEKGDLVAAERLRPRERPYPLSMEVRMRIGADES